MAGHVSLPGVQLQAKHADVSRELCFASLDGRGFENAESLAGDSCHGDVAMMRRSQAARELRNCLRPGESIPVDRSGLARNDHRSLAPFVSLQREAGLRRRQVKRQLERGLYVGRRAQSSYLRCGLIVRAFLQIRVHQILDRMRELIRDELIVLPRWRRECRICCAQIAPDHAVPIAEPSVDVRRHVERVRIAWRCQLVLARDLERLSFASGYIIGMHEIVHRAGMVRIPVVHAQQNFGRSIGVRARHRVGRSGGEQRESIEDGGLVVVWQRVMSNLRRVLPSANAQPIVQRRWLQVKRFGRRHEKALPLRGRMKRLGGLHGIPTALKLLRTRAGRPQRLEQRHRDSPLRHRASGVGRRHPLETVARLRVGHVMQQREGVIELGLRWCGARDGEVDDAQRVCVMVRELVGRPSCAADEPSRDDYRADANDGSRTHGHERPGCFG
jgi:hypothetical protein